MLRNQKEMKLQVRSSQAVGIWLIMLIVTQFPTFSRGGGADDHDDDDDDYRQRLIINTNFLKTFFRYFGVIPKYAQLKINSNSNKNKNKGKGKTVHVVSRRLVPGGPNPLHN